MAQSLSVLRALSLAVSLIAAAVLFAGSIPAYAQSTLSCSPSQQNAGVGQTVTFEARGGSGSYVWATPSSVSSNSGSSFSTSFNETGPNTVIVRSGGQDALCVVNVGGTSLGGSVNPEPIAQVPGLPFTGEGGGALGVSPLMVLFGALMMAGLSVAAIYGIKTVLRA